MAIVEGANPSVKYAGKFIYLKFYINIIIIKKRLIKMLVK